MAGECILNDIQLLNSSPLEPSAGPASKVRGGISVIKSHNGFAALRGIKSTSYFTTLM